MVAIEIAERLRDFGGAEIIYADSAAVYRYLDVGTAKPSHPIRKRVPHHMIDVVLPDQQFNAKVYAEMATEIIRNVIGKGKIPIVTGGTGLYIKALVHGLFSVSPGIKEVREELDIEDREKGMGVLYRELLRVDPESASSINKNDHIRIKRALEVYRKTGVPISKLRQDHAFKEKIFDPVYVGLALKRKVLYERIEERVDDMIKDKITDEVKNIIRLGYDPKSFALSTIGYKEITEYLTGEITLDEAVSLIKRNTRRLAKRQMTWFKKIPGVNWFEYPFDIDGIVSFIKRGIVINKY